MKIRKFYENYTLESVDKILKDYQNFTTIIEPFVYEKYNELANDEEYYPDYGDRPYPLKIEDLVIGHASSHPSGFTFILDTYNKDGMINGTFYVDIENEEMEEALLKITAGKYNL
jgi:hypothetical protein